MRKILSFLFLAFVALASNNTRILAQSKAEVSRKESIPKNYQTYSLFLVCNPQWLSPEKNDDLGNLYLQFRNFGRAIGDDHLAVWFWTSGSLKRETDFAQDLDVERSVRFCKAWKLQPSMGPHLVVTSTYPDEEDFSSGLPKNSAVYQLGDMNPKDISALLAKLTDELVSKGQVDSPTASPPASASLWVRLLEATQQTINSFGCAWSFKIDAGPVNAALQSCKTR